MTQMDEEIARLNEGLREVEQTGKTVSIDVRGRPNSRILSFEPLQYEQYGRFLNRGPSLMGSFVVRQLMVISFGNGGEAPAIAFETGGGDIYTKIPEIPYTMNKIGSLITSDPDYRRWALLDNNHIGEVHSVSTE
jgi:hypothetical protein